MLPTTLAILLLLTGLAIALMEVLIPSAGILGIIAAGTLLGSLVVAFMHNPIFGYTLLAVVAVSLPVIIVLGFKMLPNSPIGRRLILSSPTDPQEALGKAGVSGKDFAPLLGKSGATLSPLRPSGFALIDDQRYTVVAKGEMIEQGADIVVVNVEGNSIVVETSQTQA